MFVTLKGRFTISPVFFCHVLVVH